MGNSNKSTFCVEIKPKQGIYTKSDKQFTKCSHCLMQYYKTRHGKYPKRDYCPRELFSLYPEKIKFALRNLLMSPQNNLRIFENGQLVYDHDEGDLGAVLKRWFGIKDGVDNETKFLDLVCQTLTRDIYFERSDDLDDWESKYAAVELRAMKVKAPSRLNPELVQEAQTLLQSVNQCLEIRPDYEHDDFRNVCRLGWKGLHYSVRARILEMQLSHQCGTDVVAWIRNNLSVILDDEMTISQLDRFSLAARCENAVDSDDVESRKRKILSDWIKQGKISEQNRKEEDACNQLIDENILKNFTIEDCCQILQNYLIFCTARDCSIMMAFQEEVKDKHFDNNREIDLESGQRFIFNIQVADLDPKKLGCIKKHCRRDNDVLKATIEQLKRR